MNIDETEVIKILHEIAQNESEKYRDFKESLVEYCTNNKNAVTTVFRILRGIEQELSICLSRNVQVNVDRTIIIKVLKATQTELEIVRYRMKFPHLFEHEIEQETSAIPQPVGKWTDDKLNLIELIYAISKTKSVNNGNIKIKEIQRCFEYVFQVKLGNISQRLSEIDNRKHHENLYLEMLLKNLSDFLDEMNV